MQLIKFVLQDASTIVATVWVCRCALQSADNILVCSSNDAPTRMTAKVSDMGLCAAVKHANRSAASSVRALSHVAPEVQRGGRAEPSSDIFAFGVLMWEVFTGQQAYRKLLDAEHLYEVIYVEAVVWGGYSPSKAGRCNANQGFTHAVFMKCESVMLHEGWLCTVPV
jgi:serine/threonine protein kinase